MRKKKLRFYSLNLSNLQIQEIKNVLTDLEWIETLKMYGKASLLSNKVHQDKICLLPCCTYKEYLESKKGRGRYFDSSTFFLEWLIRYVTKSMAGKGSIYLKASMLLEKYNLNLGWGWSPSSSHPKTASRIKVMTWRLKKSGILPKIERRIKRRKKSLFNSKSS